MVPIFTMKLIRANEFQVHEIWEILRKAILRRKSEGSRQWQDGYPNPEIIQDDIVTRSGYVAIEKRQLIAYVCLKINDEPAYAELEGKWLSNSDFVVIHRLAVAEDRLGQGIATAIFHSIEDFARKKNIQSIKIDTNFDNYPMLRLLGNMGYSYCGKVYFRESQRKAYEKILFR